MKKKAPTSGYNSPLRERQKEQTREMILAAVASILSHADTSAVTIGEVARVADVTMRTVFRHFSTREELLSVFWKWHLEKSGGGTVLVEPQSVEQLLDTIKKLFASLDEDEGVVRAVISSAEGREIRTQANQRRLETMLKFIAPLVPGLSKRDRHQMASGIISVCSVLSWMFMRDNCGYDGKRAGEAAAFAVQLMIEGGQRRSAALMAQRGAEA
jgi:AcrR family transcriptional regulator